MSATTLSLLLTACLQATTVPTDPDSLIERLEASFAEASQVRYTASVELRWSLGGDGSRTELRHGTFLRDREHYAVDYTQNVGPDLSTTAATTDRRFFIRVSDVGLYYSTVGEAIPKYLFRIPDLEAARHRARVFLGPSASIINGFVGEDELASLVEVLRGAQTTRVRERMESVDGHATVVLEAATADFGAYVLWLDPELSFWPRRVHITKRGEHLPDGVVGSGASAGIEPAEVDEYEIVAVLKEFDRSMGRIYPTRASTTVRIKFMSGQATEMGDAVHITEISYHEGADRRRFDPDVPDGTPVLNLETGDEHAGTSGVAYEWRGGNLVPYVDREAAARIDQHAQDLHGRVQDAPRDTLDSQTLLSILLLLVATAVAVGVGAFIWRRRHAGS